MEDSAVDRHPCLLAGSSAWTHLWETSTVKTEKQKSAICITDFTDQVRNNLKQGITQ